MTCMPVHVSFMFDPALLFSHCKVTYTLAGGWRYAIMCCCVIIILLLFTIVQMLRTHYPVSLRVAHRVLRRDIIVNSALRPMTVA